MKLLFGALSDATKSSKIVKKSIILHYVHLGLSIYCSKLRSDFLFRLFILSIHMKPLSAIMQYQYQLLSRTFLDVVFALQV